jgi:hypothetical protein
MQNSVAAQRFYDAAPALVQQTMDEVGALTGRQYKLFDYHGTSAALATANTAHKHRAHAYGPPLTTKPRCVSCRCPQATRRLTAS